MQSRLLFTITNGLCETLAMNAVPSQRGLLAELSWFTQGCRRERERPMGNWQAGTVHASGLNANWACMNPSHSLLRQSFGAVCHWKCTVAAPWLCRIAHLQYIQYSMSLLLTNSHGNSALAPQSFNTNKQARPHNSKRPTHRSWRKLYCEESSFQ